MDGRHPMVLALIQNFLHCSLRIPGLIILELMLRYHLNKDGDELGKNFTKWHQEFNGWLQYFEFSRFVKSRNFDSVLENVLIGCIFTLSVTFLLLPIKKLVSMYLHVASVFLLGAGFYLSYRYVEHEKFKRDEVILDDFIKLERHGFHFLSQVMLATLVSCLLSISSGPVRCTLTLGALPIVARLCGFPVEKLHLVHNFGCCFLMLVVCFYILNAVPSILSLLRRTRMYLTNQMAAEGGYWHVGGVVWRWLNLPPLFAWFFVVLCLTELYVLNQKGFLREKTHTPDSLREQILLAVSSCCSTPLSLAGFGAVTFYFSYVTLFVTKIYLKNFLPNFDHHENQVDPDISRPCYIESIALLIMSTQSGLIDQPVDQKATLICIFLFILLSSLLQSIFDIFEPISMEISVTPYSNMGKHIRTLSIAAVLLVLPLVMSIYIAFLLVVDIWLMIIISSCILISVQTAGSLVNYFLFIYDAYCRKNENWHKLDDLVFYNMGVVRGLEFLVAISVIVTFGVREFLHGSWSWTNLFFLSIHCYVNVWERLQAGWKTFLARREAAKKLSVFPEANKQQLKSYGDVCSICFMNLNEAKMTPCKHFFHATCLKKWLYVQLYCPLCHFDLNFQKNDVTAEKSENPQVNLNNLDSDDSFWDNEDENFDSFDENEEI